MIDWLVITKERQKSVFLFVIIYFKINFVLWEKNICLNGLKKVLRPKDMKNITGGSYRYCWCYDGSAWHCYNASAGSDCGINDYCHPGGGSCD